MKTIKNALRILSLFKDADRPLGVNDVAERLDYSKSYVSRVLASMRDMDFLQQDPGSRKYTVGVESFALGTRYIVDMPLTRDALPVMWDICNDTGDSVLLSVRHDTICRHIQAVEGPHFKESRWRVGVRLPLHASASGKVLLAFAPTEDQEAFLRAQTLERYTPNTITDADALRDELAAVRDSGHSLSRGERVKGLVACAVPVYGEQEALAAALSIIMPEHLLPDRDLAHAIGVLHAGARRLSLLAGARVYPY